MKDFGCLNKHDHSIIPEDEIEFSKRMNIEEELDHISFIKNGNWLVSKMSNKIKKNKYFILSLLIIAVVYFIILFESLMPMYEAKLVIIGFNGKSGKVTLDKTHEFKLLMKNKAVIYFVLFHLFFSFFLFSFLRIALMDPGLYEKEYTELYSLKNYNELYTKFYFKFLMERPKTEYNTNKDKIKSDSIVISPSNNSRVEIPQNNFKSNSLVITNGSKHTGYESDNDSIIVDPEEKVTPTNEKTKKFENLISQIRNSENYRYYWNLNCFNYTKRSIRDNLCRFCMVIKPERAFHCKQCRKCIKKMDHHCLFLNNCIGLNNYKLFFNMLFYATLICGFTVVIMIDTFKFILNEYSFCLYSAMYMSMLVLVSLIGSLVFYFMFYHFTLILKGITQLEDTFRFDQRYDDYYEFLGKYSKWQKFLIIFGTNPLLWILPIKITNNYRDGYTFK